MTHASVCQLCMFDKTCLCICQPLDLAHSVCQLCTFEKTCLCTCQPLDLGRSVCQLYMFYKSWLCAVQIQCTEQSVFVSPVCFTGLPNLPSMSIVIVSHLYTMTGCVLVSMLTYLFSVFVSHYSDRVLYHMTESKLTLPPLALVSALSARNGLNCSGYLWL